MLQSSAIQNADPTSASLPPSRESTLPTTQQPDGDLSRIQFSNAVRADVSAETRSFLTEFIDAVRVRGDVEALLNIARQSPLESIQQLVRSVESKVESERQEIASGVQQVNAKEVFQSLKQLSSSERSKLDEAFSRMIAEIREQTTFLAALEAPNIAYALEKCDLYGQHYSCRITSKESEEEGGGRFFSGINLISVAIRTKSLFGIESGQSKDTVLSCWPLLASEGTLPFTVETIRHELHHADQHGYNIFYRLLDLLPNVRLPLLPLLHPQPGISETTAHLLPLLEPHGRPSQNVNEITRSLMHPEFSFYHFTSECSHEMVQKTHRMILLGMTEKELATLANRSRFRGYEGVMKLLNDEETKRRGEQNLTNDDDYALTLALRQADRLIDSSIQRLKTQRIAQSALEEIIGVSNAG